MITMIRQTVDTKKAINLPYTAIKGIGIVTILPTLNKTKRVMPVVLGGTRDSGNIH